jgi:hypothetical protein
MFNAHIRDNLLVLKVSRDDLGRVSELSSATLADLSASNLTGLAKPGAGNSFTAGTTRFQSTARCVLPVGADKYEDLGGGNRRGLWVEGDYLHHIASNQTTEYRYLGEYVSTPAGADPGSCWIEGAYLHYIDADGDERRCQSAGATGAHTDTGALPGSAWVETYVHWIAETGGAEQPGHGDVAHSDGTVHNDTHSDTAHSDAHSDSGHADSHGDDAHVDDGHVDDAHVDETHHDGGTTHDDIPHGDEPHGDDAHADSHTDAAHSNTHSDSHGDTHADHSDHGDVAAQSQPTVVP